MSGILDLPPELIERILSSLVSQIISDRNSVKLAAVLNLREVSLTCSYLHGVASSGRIWQNVCLVQFGCAVVRRNARTFYREVLVRYGDMLGRYFIPLIWNGSDQRLTYLKCQFNERTESLTIVKRGLPALSHFFQPNSTRDIASISLTSEGKGGVSCLSEQCHSPDILRRTNHHHVSLNLIQSYYTLTFIPNRSHLTTVNIRHTSHAGLTISRFYHALPLHIPVVSAGVVCDGYFVGLGLHSTVLALYYLQCTAGGIVLHSAHANMTVDGYRRVLTKHDSIIADYSDAIKLMKTETGIAFANDSMRMCVEWRFRRRLSNKPFNQELGFLFIPGVQPPTTYQIMLRGYLEGRSPDEIRDCILVVFNNNCVGIIEGGTVYLYKRLD